MRTLIEEVKIVESLKPQSAAGALTGVAASMKDYRHATVVVTIAKGAGAETDTVFVEQCTTVAGAGNKALDFTQFWLNSDANKVPSGDVFTKTTQAAANTVAGGGTANKTKQHIIEFDDSDLDIENDYNCIRVNLTGAIATGVIHAQIILSQPRYGINLPTTGTD